MSSSRYTLLYLQLKHCPRVSGWFLLIPSRDIDLQQDMHAAVTRKLFMKECDDPHKAGDGQLNVVRLGAGFFSTMFRLSMEGDVVMNRDGGISPLLGWEEVARKQIDTLSFPPAEGEKISISKWSDPAATHYYLKSSVGRLFSPSKYDTIDEAMEAARKVAPDECISLEKPVGYKRKDGD